LLPHGLPVGFGLLGDVAVVAGDGGGGLAHGGGLSG
jgi:hypothetical protein